MQFIFDIQKLMAIGHGKAIPLSEAITLLETIKAEADQIIAKHLAPADHDPISICLGNVPPGEEDGLHFALETEGDLKLQLSQANAIVEDINAMLNRMATPGT